MDALADPHLPPGRLPDPEPIFGTEGHACGNAAYARHRTACIGLTETLLAQPEQGAPGRIIILDSPPVLAASPAAALAGHVGQLIIVVRRSDARIFAARCGRVDGRLPAYPAASQRGEIPPGGRRFGTYYGQEARHDARPDLFARRCRDRGVVAAGDGRAGAQWSQDSGSGSGSGASDAALVRCGVRRQARREAEEAPPGRSSALSRDRPVLIAELQEWRRRAHLQYDQRPGSMR